MSVGKGGAGIEKEWRLHEKGDEKVLSWGGI